MRQKAVIVVVYIWLFFFLGLVLHTSSHPQIFRKYTIKYFLALLLLVVLFPLIIKLTNYIFKTSVYKFKKKKYEFDWIRKSVLIGLFFILIIFLPVEFFLRHKFKNYESNSYQYTIDNFHPFLQAQLEKDDNIHVNSYGFRNDEISLKKPSNTFRIVIIGGSTVLNREVPFEKNAARLLELSLQKKYPDKKIEVINAGKDGYNSEHSLIQYLFNIKDFSPDLIIMWQGVNDLYLSCTPSANEYGNFKRDYSHAFGAVTRMVLEYFRPKPLISGKSVAFDFLMKNLSDNLYSDIVKSIKKRTEEKKADSFRKGGSGYITIDNFPSIRTYERNLVSMIKVVRDDKVPIILGNQANLYKNSVNLEESKRLIFPNLVCQKDGKYYSMGSIKKGMEEINEITKRVANENDVSFIDLDSQIPKNLNYFLDSVHYTEKGNALIAEILFKYIQDQQFIK